MYLFIHICMPYSTYIMHTCMHMLLLCFFCTHSWALFCPDFFGSRIFAAELRICSKLSLNKAQKTQREKNTSWPGYSPAFFVGSLVISNKALMLEVFFASKSQGARFAKRKDLCDSSLHYPLFFLCHELDQTNSKTG